MRAGNVIIVLNVWVGVFLMTLPRCDNRNDRRYFSATREAEHASDRRRRPAEEKD
jgi:hypothetical protein